MTDQLLIALERQKIDLPLQKDQEVVLFTPENRKIAVATAEELRDAGKIVSLVRMDLGTKSVSDYTEQYGTLKQIVLDGEYNG